MTFIRASNDSEFCRQIEELRQSCACLPVIWTDCGCTPDVDPDASTFASAGRVDTFVNAVNLTRSTGFDLNRSGSGTSYEGHDRATWLTQYSEIIAPEEIQVRPAMIVGFEITIERLVADITEGWFVLSYGQREIGIGLTLLPPHVLATINLDTDPVTGATDLGVHGVTTAGQIRFKLDLASPKRIYVPILKPTAESVTALPLDYQLRPGSQQTATGMSGVATAAMLISRRRAEDSEMLPVEVTLGHSALTEFPYHFRATLRPLSQESGQLRRAIQSLHHIITELRIRSWLNLLFARVALPSVVAISSIAGTPTCLLARPFLLLGSRLLSKVSWRKTAIR